MTKKTVALAAMAALLGATALSTEGHAQSRTQIQIVGSSTVFPFATAVAENFGRTTSYQTPVIESTGSGGGLKLFCAGVGIEHPDITNASRRIKSSEVETCANNGVTEITEVKVGFDGIVIANSVASPQTNYTREQLWLALAEKVPVDGEIVMNPHERWSDIDPSLPNKEIIVLGPPPTSGTRDAFVELVMEEACESFDAVTALPEDEKKEVCAKIREDGAFIDAGENDNVIVQRLESDRAAYGIFGFSFLDQNRDKIQGSRVDGEAPTFENIAEGDYPVSRSLYFYVKNAHADVIPGIRDYLAEFTSERAMGEEGYLAEKGLIPLPEDMREEVRSSTMNLVPLKL